MHIKRLLDATSKISEQPIEIDDLAKIIVEFGCQDKIIFHPDKELNENHIRGIFYQYTTRPGVYAEPELVTLIIYSANQEVEWQRLVCCKELVHWGDKEIEKTSTAETLDELLDKILVPFSTENFGIADIMASKDKLATYIALGILFPPLAREEAIASLESGEKTIEQVATWVGLPVRLVEVVINERWPKLFEILVQMA